MPVFKQRVRQALAARSAKGLTRTLQCLDGANRAKFEYGERALTNFSSNDYLGLACDADLALAWQKGIDQCGVGSAASPLVSGFSSAHQALEDALCTWLGYSRAILFGSGFSANQAVLFSLLQKGDGLYQDRLNHASLMEAGMLSPAQMKRFRHNDVDHLASLLHSTNSQSSTLNPQGANMVVTEGVFSMDGDLAPLNAVANTCQATDSLLMVDDAHGVGVLGAQGRGSCEQAGVKPDILVVTFGKAFGLSGAAVMCGAEMGDYLTQFARHHVYSTAIAPSQAYALAHAVDKISLEEWRREKLASLQHVYQQHLGDMSGYIETNTPIKPFILGSSDNAMKVATQLKQQGFWVTAIRPPTVPSGQARLRLTLTANHSRQDVINLASAIRPLLEDLRC